MVAEGRCWIWQHAIDGSGYGEFRQGGKNYKAHRVMYELYKGQVPVGLELDHLCREKKCWNPSHLEAVTHRENCRRGDAGRWMRDRDSCSRGHKYLPGSFTLRSDSARICRICGRDKVRAWRLARKAAGSIEQA